MRAVHEPAAPAHMDGMVTQLPAPDPKYPWLHVGARVAILSGGGIGIRASYDEAVVAKITATQIVLEGGERYRRSDLTQTGRGAWDTIRELTALDSPKAAESRRFKALRLARNKAVRALDEFRKTIDHSAFDAPLPDPADLIAEITDLYERSQALHAGRPKED